MQQKKIIFAILSIVYGSTYTMEQNNELNTENFHEKGYFRYTTTKNKNVMLLPLPYLNDFILQNFSYDYNSDRFSINTSGKVRENANRLSVLPGAAQTRNEHAWVINEVTDQKYRFFYVQNIDQANQELNATKVSVKERDNK
ncbi:MAG TPA: hypothetical protein VL201_01005 [Patescibacteria group bacterium]|jgi:hypothetical protein|nr:hypothetical protein [Patescibacteria group bacterium]